MKKVFVDTNIIIDLLGDRQPFNRHAAALFHKAESGHVLLYTSPLSIATSYYVLQKFLEEKKLRITLLSLLEFVSILPLDADAVLKSLRSTHRDFEDALQMYCAATMTDMSFIVTRNAKDFQNSGIPVLTALECCERLE